MMAERNSFERSSVEIPTSPVAPGPSAEAAGDSYETAREADPTYDHVIQSDVRETREEAMHLMDE